MRFHLALGQHAYLFVHPDHYRRILPAVDVAFTDFSGASISLRPFITHRMPEFWEAPDEFRPERFREGAPSHPFAYIPALHPPSPLMLSAKRA